jgi:uncharacterized protein YceK
MKRFVLALLCLGSLLLFSGCASTEKAKSSTPSYQSQRVDLEEADTNPGRTDGEREEIWGDYNKVMKDSEQMR